MIRNPFHHWYPYYHGWPTRLGTLRVLDIKDQPSDSERGEIPTRLRLSRDY